MKKILLLLVLFGLIFNQVDAQRNFAAKKLLFSQVQKPYINYGYLYNWYAATDSRSITSSNEWSVMTRNDFSTLQTYLGGFATAGGKLKQNGTIYWLSPNTGATNEVLFNARGSGIRSGITGVFSGLGSSANFINFDQSNFYSNINYNSSQFNLIANTGNNIAAGFSIRLIYVGIGNPTSYIGNNGYIYRSITINGITYLADNLAETKYRNGDWITGFDGGVYTPISNANWAAKTTEAMCIYNDDENNR